MTWNGTEITKPILIFQDELPFETVFADLNAPGALICRSSIARPHWRDVGNSVIKATNDTIIKQIRTPGPGHSQLLRGSRGGSTSNDHNGLITCRIKTMQDAINVVASFKYVALYIREAGERWNHGQARLCISYTCASSSYTFCCHLPGCGVITSNEVSLSSSSFMADPPTFTLYGDTSGGPPETRMWTRDGQVITDDDSHNISIAVNGGTATSSPSYDVRRNCHYRSTLAVRGNLPGVYQYSAGNRVTNPMVMDSFNIGGRQLETMSSCARIWLLLCSWSSS